jgi:ABC-type multidrug transport system fused ATPase/permease subunit
VSAGRLDGIMLAACVLVALGAFEATQPLADAARRLAACAGAATRVEEILDARPPIVDPRHPVALPAAGALRADHVTVWPVGAAAPTLRDVSLTLRPGGRIAIVGASGAGKTTLARALVRFAEPAGGTVTLGDVDIADAAQAQVRHAVRLVSQEAHLFTTTLRTNVAIGNADADDAAIVAALDGAGLGDWWRTLPDGLDTVLGEEGAAVSGGQRRRIALARGFVADARFLVLDEPTAHLDEAGGTALLHRLASERDDRGVLVISHAVAGLEGFDELLVLDGGRVVERGTPAELARAGGAFAALAAAA